MILLPSGKRSLSSRQARYTENISFNKIPRSSHDLNISYNTGLTTMPCILIDKQILQTEKPVNFIESFVLF